MTDLAPVTYNVTTGQLSYDNGAGLIDIPYTGPQGATGSTGATGAAGQGVPTGGTIGQSLIKNSGTNYDTSWSTISSSAGGSSIPSGRLTLTASTPVMTADATAQATIYYAPYRFGITVPIYDGFSMISRQFTSSDTDTVGLTLGLDSNTGHTNYHQNDKIFDLFIYWDSTLCRLASGPAWTSLSARGTGAGTTELQMFKGGFTNKNSIVLRYGTNSGDTATISANQATYVGSVYCTANGQTGMAVRPARASGGTNNKLALYNAYNRIRMRATCADSTSTWTYASGTVRSANNSTNNRIWWLDGLGETQVKGIAQGTVSPGSTSANAYTFGVAFDSTSQMGVGTINQIAFVGATNVGTSCTGSDVTTLLGWHYCQFLEQSTAVSMTVFGNGFSGLELETEA
jgi:hypothetical protein